MATAFGFGKKNVRVESSRLVGEKKTLVGTGAHLEGRAMRQFAFFLSMRGIRPLACSTNWQLLDYLLAKNSKKVEKTEILAPDR